MDSLFVDALFSELKKFSAEELLIKCIEIIDGLDLKPLQTELNNVSRIKLDDSLIKLKRDISLIKEKIKGQLQNLVIYVGEIYRRNIMTCYDLFKNINDYLECGCFFCNEKKLEYHIIESGRQISELICSQCNSKYSNITPSKPHYGFFIKGLYYTDIKSKILCDDDLTRKQIKLYEYIYDISIYNTVFKDKLQEIQMVKQTMLKIMKTPLLTKELETCMDEILDLNGNRISHLKEYLTEDQYRFVRSGAKFEELESQQDMLDNLNKMLKQLKICAVGQSIMDLPVARPITPEIKHLERELESHNFIQKKHEKDLEKLKCKI